MYTYVGSVRPVGHPCQVDEPTERTIGRVILLDLDLTETLAELQQHVDSQDTGCLDQGVADEDATPYYWCAQPMDVAIAHDSPSSDLLS